MKNVLIILALLFTTHFFNNNNLQAQAQIGLVNTTGDNGNIIGNEDIRLRLINYQTLSQDDCEKETTLTGTIKIIDILDNPNSSLTGPTSFKARKSRRRGHTSSSNTLNGPNSLTTGTGGGNNENLTHTYPIPPVNGNTLSFDNSNLKSLVRFGDKFYIEFTFNDIDRNCENNGIDPIDINPNKDSFKSVKLFVNLKTKQVRLVNNDNTLGAVIGNPFTPFTVQGNPPSKYSKMKIHTEVGKLKMMFYIKKDINKLKSN